MKDCTVTDWTLTDGFTRTDNEGLYSDGLDTDRWIHKDRQLDRWIHKDRQ